MLAAFAQPSCCPAHRRRHAQSHGPNSVADIAARLQNAVVNISTTQKLKESRQIPLPEVPEGSPFEEFFQDFFNKEDRGGGQRANSLGSGFIIDPEGLIVTNNHVIEGADEITVILADGTKLKVAEVVGRDAKTDLALLRVKPKAPLPSVKFGDSQAMRVGDWVMAIGNPFGLGGTLTVGVISATRRDIKSGSYDEFLQTDAAINRGNSGGPLFNMDGDVIGMNTAIISPTGGSIGIGFAVPSNTVAQVLGQLKQFGETRRGWLGVRIQTVTERDRRERRPAARGRGAGRLGDAGRTGRRRRYPGQRYHPDLRRQRHLGHAPIAQGRRPDRHRQDRRHRGAAQERPHDPEGQGRPAGGRGRETGSRQEIG